ncbi:isopentenyl phosphate kinase family protein, partial [bacterium]|nr:isopentenyl phosphate kinase family protein [bacterium]
NKEIIKRIAKEISLAKKEKSFRLLIGNGGGSYPHVPAKKYKTAEGVINKNSYKGIAEVQDAASRLNRIVIRALLDAGENAISVQPSSVCLTKNSRIVEFYTKPLEIFLEKGMVPVIYGDVGLDLKKGCSIISTEELFVFLAKKLKPKRIIFAGIVDGVFTADPLKQPDAKLITEINSKNYPKIKKMLSGSAGIDVTGGMLLKVEKCLELAQVGVVSYIINGAVKNRLKDTLLKKRVKGTVIRE